MAGMTKGYEMKKELKLKKNINEYLYESKFNNFLVPSLLPGNIIV